MAYLLIASLVLIYRWLKNKEVMDLPTKPWVYKPSAWDHEELHQAYQRDPEVPPDSIIVTLLDADGKKVPSTSLQVTKTKDALILKDTDAAPIRFVHIRYMSTNCRVLCQDHVEDHRFIIMVSLRLWEDMDIPQDFDIHNLFIQPESAEDALAILNFLRYHMFQFLRAETEEEDPTSVLEYNCPQFTQECRVVIHWRKYSKTWQETRTLMVDSDCVIFYRKPFEDSHKPRDRLFFWLEQKPKTLSKVSRIKNQNLILLHSLFMYITIEYEEETGPAIEAAFQQVKPVPRKALEEPKILFHWLAGNYDPERDQILPPPPVIVPVNLNEEQEQKLNQFERELYKGMLYLPNDQSDIIWNNIRPQLEDSYFNQKLSTMDKTKWDYNPSSVDSFLEVVRMIETELFRNVNYVKALAITVAMTETFKNSGVERIRKLMEDNPMDFLHKIHARGNIMAQPSLQVGSGEGLLLPLEEDDILMENEESEGGEMADVQDLQ